MNDSFRVFLRFVVCRYVNDSLGHPINRFKCAQTNIDASPAPSCLDSPGLCSVFVS